jgi:hypothetical protein
MRHNIPVTTLHCVYIHYGKIQQALNPDLSGEIERSLMKRFNNYLKENQPIL